MSTVSFFSAAALSGYLREHLRADACFDCGRGGRGGYLSAKARTAKEDERSSCRRNALKSGWYEAWKAEH
jgi:hypothetical protein